MNPPLCCIVRQPRFYQLAGTRRDLNAGLQMPPVNKSLKIRAADNPPEKIQTFESPEDGAWKSPIVREGNPDRNTESLSHALKQTLRCTRFLVSCADVPRRAHTKVKGSVRLWNRELLRQQTGRREARVRHQPRLAPAGDEVVVGRTEGRCWFGVSDSSRPQSIKEFLSSNVRIEAGDDGHRVDSPSDRSSRRKLRDANAGACHKEGAQKSA
ncbi:MAG: hypothetical protein WCK05_15380 [Planctomycetota bacterium]